MRKQLVVQQNSPGVRSLESLLLLVGRSDGGFVDGICEAEKVGSRNRNTFSATEERL